MHPRKPVTSTALAHLPTLLYAGRVNCITGQGGAARHQIHVLRRHGARLLIRDVGSAGDPDPRRESAFVQAARQDSPEVAGPRASIIHVQPNMTTALRDLPRPHVLVSVWETSRLPASWVPVCNSFEQVWCATQWQADLYVASGVAGEKVRHVPFALDPALYPAGGEVLPELAALRAGGAFVFGSMFQWSERKAPRALLGAFVAAFQRGENVVLALKSYEGDDAATAVRHHVEAILRSYLPVGPMPRVEVISRQLTHNETLAYYRGLDCYVSSHRGEGFGLPIAEALLLGRPVIATGWSAPAEFAAGLFRAVPYTLEVPHSMGWQPFYTADQRWAAPDQDDLAAAMREAFEHRLEAPPLDEVRARFDSLVARAGAAARIALEDLLG